MSETNREEDESRSMESVVLRAYDIELLDDFLVRLPEVGQKWPLAIPFPSHLVEKVLLSLNSSSFLKEAIVKARTNYDSDRYVKPIETEFCSFYKIGYPKPGEYIDNLRNTSLEEKIIRSLQNPLILSSMSPVAVYIYAAIRNELILPMFGSIQSFYYSFIGYRQMSSGFIEGLKSLRFKTVLEDKISLQPHNEDLIHRVSIAIINESFVPKQGTHPASDDENDRSVLEFVLGKAEEYE